MTINDTKSPKGYFARYFAVSADQKSVGVKVGVAIGPWTTAATGEPGGAKALGTSIGKSLVFSDSLETAEGTIVIVSHNYFDDDFRLVAVDKQGASHASLGRGGCSAGEIYQMKGSGAQTQRRRPLRVPNPRV